MAGAAAVVCADRAEPRVKPPDPAAGGAVEPKVIPACTGGAAAVVLGALMPNVVVAPGVPKEKPPVAAVLLAGVPKLKPPAGLAAGAWVEVPNAKPPAGAAGVELVMPKPVAGAAAAAGGF